MREVIRGKSEGGAEKDPLWMDKVCVESSPTACYGGMGLKLGHGERVLKIAGTLRLCWTLLESHAGIAWLRTWYTNPDYFHN